MVNYGKNDFENIAMVIGGIYYRIGDF